MVKLSAAERSHIDQFLATRPDWSAFVMEERVYDEAEGGRTHKYPSPHPYVSGMHYVLEKMRELAPTKVLDIGSPLTQSIALSFLPGTEVEVLDVRPHPWADSLGLQWRTGTATALPYADASLPAVVSMWVMGHVGDGRYGDAFDVDGDRKMLAEIARVLEPGGGTAIVGPGLVAEECSTIFNLHRIYTWDWLNAEFESAGFSVIERRDFPVSDEVFVKRSADGVSIERMNGHYGAAVLRKR